MTSTDQKWIAGCVFFRGRLPAVEYLMYVVVLVGLVIVPVHKVCPLMIVL